VTPIQTPTGPTAVIVIDSVPQGADVFGPDDRKKSIGKTPARVTLPISDAPVVFELKLAGYRRKKKELVVTGNTVVQVTLDRAPASTGIKKGSGSVVSREDL
jgi:hypothetical protein